MVGFSPHFAIGMLVVIPFVFLDRKNRYLTLIIGGIAGILPDIDFLGVFVDWVEHRGAIHKFPTWLLASIGVSLILFVIILYEYWRHDRSMSFEAFQDKLIYFGAFTVGWASHIFVDFGFTQYGGRKASIFSLDEYLSIMDQGAGFVVALVLVVIIWYEVYDKAQKLQSEANLIIRQISKDYSHAQVEEEKITYLEALLSQLMIINNFRISLDQFDEIIGKEGVKEIQNGLTAYKSQIMNKSKIKYELKGDELIFIHNPFIYDFGLSAKQKIIINLFLFLVFFVLVGIIVGLFD